MPLVDRRGASGFSMNLRQTTATTLSRLHRSIHYVFRTITPLISFLSL